MESALENSYTDGLKRGRERERERERERDRDPEHARHAAANKTISGHIILLLTKLRTYKKFV
jgi:hypothetical protein